MSNRKHDQLVTAPTTPTHNVESRSSSSSAPKAQRKRSNTIGSPTPSQTRKTFMQESSPEANLEKAIGVQLPDSEKEQQWRERRQRMIQRSRLKLAFPFALAAALAAKKKDITPLAPELPTTVPVESALDDANVDDFWPAAANTRHQSHPASVPLNRVSRFSDEFENATKTLQQRRQTLPRSDAVQDLRPIGSFDNVDENTKESFFELARIALKKTMKPDTDQTTVKSTPSNRHLSHRTPLTPLEAARTVKNQTRLTSDSATTSVTPQIATTLPSRSIRRVDLPQMMLLATEERGHIDKIDASRPRSSTNVKLDDDVSDEVFTQLLLPHTTDVAEERQEGRLTSSPTIRSRHQPVSSTSLALRQHQLLLAPKRDDYRPYFTWWITTVQLIVFVISLYTYGFGPYGWQSSANTQMVMTTALALESIEYREPSNFWWGLRAQDLVHLGAKYTPCMRPERQIEQEIEDLREIERKSACCVRNDGSGCVQSTADECSRSISRWLRCPHAAGCIRGSPWTGGTVCGLDPRYCQQTSLALAASTWNRSDITTWPVCRSVLDSYDAACAENGTHCHALTLTAEPHMTCELLGRPCCYGIRGQCRLATREFCKFVQGFYHDDAFLCSQVSCLEQVCGMIPFLHANRPDQFYRLFTSLFLHAGVLQFVITLFTHFYIMQEFEKLYGWWRVALIYSLSGVTGNMVSAIFLPNVPEVGPSGSLFAIWGLWMVEEYYEWKNQVIDPHQPVNHRVQSNHPFWLMLGIGIVVLFFLMLGLLPWIDNFAQICGFCSGVALAFFCIPTGAYGIKREHNRPVYNRIRKYLPFAIFVAFFAFFMVVLYVMPLDKDTWPWFLLLNCVPFAEDFCSNQNSYFFYKGYGSF